MSPAQVAKRLSICKRRLLDLNRRGVLSSPSFTDNNGVRYFDQAWRSSTFSGGNKGMLTKVKGDLL
jgi:hypothetical protein